MRRGKALSKYPNAWTALSAMFLSNPQGPRLEIVDLVVLISSIAILLLFINFS